MNHAILALAGVLMMAGPALAQEASKPVGRYQIERFDDGVVRLDTLTGALTKCGDRDGEWRCDALAGGSSDLERQILVLREEVALLGEELGRLADRLDAFEGGELSLLPPETPPSIEKQQEKMDQAFTFAERFMQRFFDMIKEFQDEESAERI